MTRRKEKNLRCDRDRHIIDPTSGEWQDVLYNTLYGKVRREKLLWVIAQRDGVHVNRRWCVQIWRDPDLKKLLKEGKIVQIREGGHRTSRHTVLKLAH